MDCIVCGKTNAERPMAFRGENHCSELHRKILAGEYGSDLGRMFEMGLITQEQVTRMWGIDIKTGKPATMADLKVPSVNAVVE